MKTEGELGHSLKLRHFLSLGIGTIIGVGWVAGLGGWLGGAGSLGSALAFVVGGLAIMVIGMSYAHAGARFPHAGGEIAYAFAIFGSNAAFCAGWTLVLVYVSTSVFEAAAIGWILGEIWPHLKGPVLYSVLGADVHAGALALQLVALITIVVMNWRGTRLAGSMQDVLTITLVVCSSTIVVLGLYFGSAENLVPLFSPADGRSAWSGFLTVLATTPFWYAGFNTVAQALSERSESTPATAFGSAILISLVFCIIFYTMIIISGAMAAPRDKLLAFNLPAADAFAYALNDAKARQLVLVVGLIGLLTTWNAVVFAGARVLLTLGRAGFLPSWVGYVDPSRHTPVGALVVIGVATACGALFGSNAIELAVGASSSGLTLVYFLVTIGVLTLLLRHRRSALRPTGHIAIAALGVGISVCLFWLTLSAPLRGGSASIPHFSIVGGWIAIGVLIWSLTHDTRSRLSSDDQHRPFSAL